MRHPRERMPEERTEKVLRVGVAVPGTPSGERMGRGRGNSLTLCFSSTLQAIVLAGKILRSVCVWGGVSPSSKLNSEKQQAAIVPEPCLSTLAPAQAFPAGSELCNYPYDNYAWQKASAFLGEAFPATTSLFCLVLDLHRINQQPGWEGTQAACAGGRWILVRQRLQGNPSAPVSLAFWMYTAP